MAVVNNIMQNNIKYVSKKYDDLFQIDNKIAVSLSPSRIANAIKNYI